MTDPADLTDTMFSTPEMAAIFSGEARVRQMLAFEAALARAAPSPSHRAKAKKMVSPSARSPSPCRTMSNR